MDSRLEKIRYFKANVMDFESYINDRIKQTKRENGKIEENFSPETFESYGLDPTENIPEECINYVISNIEDFGVRYDLALKQIGRIRCSLKYADSQLFDEIYELANEWLLENDYDECDTEDIEEIFG